MADNILDLFDNLFDSVDSSVLAEIVHNHDIDALLNHIDNSGIDLTQYSDHEISNAIEHVLDNISFDSNDALINSIIEKIDIGSDNLSSVIPIIDGADISDLDKRNLLNNVIQETSSTIYEDKLSSNPVENYFGKNIGTHTSSLSFKGIKHLLDMNHHNVQYLVEKIAESAPKDIPESMLYKQEMHKIFERFLKALGIS